MLEQFPHLPVTDDGVIVPKSCFGDAKEVAVRQENGHVVLEPIANTGDVAASLPVADPDDPLGKWGSDPIDAPITNAPNNLGAKQATSGPVPPEDPLWRMCELAVDIDVTDASTNLDKYLYDYDK